MDPGNWTDPLVQVQSVQERGRKRRTFKPEFKARVVLEEFKTAGQICREHQFSPQVFARWKAEFVERAPEIFVGSGHEAKTVRIAGRVLVRDRQVLTADEVAIRAEAQAEAVARRVAADPVHKEMALLAAMEAGQL
jgi:transposase-like protein